jgi:class 3 adenylate cyclase
MERQADHQVLEVHDIFWQSYARRDLDARFAVCDPDITFFGTGSHERAVNREQYRTMNEKGVEQYPDPFQIEFLWTDVRVWDQVAVVEGESRWIMGQGATPLVMSNRHTTIFRRENGRWWVVHVHGSEADYRVQDGEYMTVGVVIERNAELEREVVQRNLDLRLERDRSEALLLNILPRRVADELKATGKAEAVQFDQVTVLFTDFKGFTAMSEMVTPQELIHDLNDCFSAFDHITSRHGIEKIKTIGDAYMAAGGLPIPNTTHATDVVKAALEIRDHIADVKARKVVAGLPYFEIRIGIHTGPVVAGIVGVKKFQYDIWGDTVNTASRMESSGEVGQVNISESTYALVKDVLGFTFTPRGKVQAKGKGEMEMFFVERMPAVAGGYGG